MMADGYDTRYMQRSGTSIDRSRARLVLREIPVSSIGHGRRASKATRPKNEILKKCEVSRLSERLGWGTKVGWRNEDDDETRTGI